MNIGNYIRYTIFQTGWGYFGLASTEAGLCRSFLPLPDKEQAEQQLRSVYRAVTHDARLFYPVQQKIQAYFRGRNVNFGPDVRVDLTEITNSEFAKKILTACRDIKYGCTVTYAQLAAQAGSASAARAAGSVMAHNPLPLIIPCHRVIRSDGKIGGFSAADGPETKKRLLKLESCTGYCNTKCKVGN